MTLTEVVSLLTFVVGLLTLIVNVVHVTFEITMKLSKEKEQNKKK